MPIAPSHRNIGDQLSQAVLRSKGTQTGAANQGLEIVLDGGQSLADWIVVYPPGTNTPVVDPAEDNGGAWRPTHVTYDLRGGIFAFEIRGSVTLGAVGKADLGAAFGAPAGPQTVASRPYLDSPAGAHIAGEHLLHQAGIAQVTGVASTNLSIYVFATAAITATGPFEVWLTRLAA